MESRKRGKKNYFVYEIETRMMGYNGITHSEYFIIIFVSFKITIWAFWVLRNRKKKLKKFVQLFFVRSLFCEINPLLFIDVKIKRARKKRVEKFMRMAF